MFPRSKVRKVVPLMTKRCERCGRTLRRDDRNPRRHQVKEIPRIEPVVTEYRQHRLQCAGADCRHVTVAPLPPGVPRGGLGPQAEAMVAYVGVARVSRRVVGEQTADWFGFRWPKWNSAGAKPCRNPWKGLTSTFWSNPWRAHETGSRQRKRAWLWLLATPSVTAGFTPAATEAARALLGAFRGIFVTDRWVAYDR